MISVIIPTHNRLPVLKRALKALESQTVPSSQFEVIVVDDGSSDGSSEWLATYLPPFRFKVMRHETKKGPAAARNTALRNASGKWTLFLNDDSIASPDLIAQHLEAQRRYQGEAVLGSFPLAAGHIRSPFSFLAAHHDLYFSVRSLIPGKLYEFDYFWTCNVSVRTDLVREVGMFDETFTEPAGEDIELGFRLQEYCGIFVRYVPECVAFHDHAPSLEHFPENRRMKGRAAVDVAARHPSLAHWAVGRERIDVTATRLIEDYLERHREQANAIMDRVRDLEFSREHWDVREMVSAASRIAGPLLFLSNYFWVQGLKERLLQQKDAHSETVANIPHRTLPRRGPKVSVVIPTYNYGSYLKEAVESVVQQSLKDVEVLIVDDGSTDETKQIAQMLIEKYSNVSIRFLSQSHSGHPSIARNRGIAEAVGEYIVCLDADDMLGPDFLEKAAAALDRNPHISIAYPDQQNFGAKSTFEQHPDYDFHSLCSYNFIPPCAMFRRKAWYDAGGFPEADCYEDWWFWVACGKKGHFGMRVPGIVWMYRHHGESRYSQQRRKDSMLKARMVLAHQELYSQMQRRWAEAVLREEPWSLSPAIPVGVIPDDAAVTKLENGMELLMPQKARPTSQSVMYTQPRERLSQLRVMFLMYGWHDDGGGTILPRELALELAKRGTRVTVVYTASTSRPDLPPYTTLREEERGVELYAIYNRPALFWDPQNPERELVDEKMVSLLASLLDKVRPDVIHIHSFLSYSAAVLEMAAKRGAAVIYTTHNYWPVCPRLYLFHDDLRLCNGPSEDGAKCASCVGQHGKEAAYARRYREVRDAFGRYVDCVLAVSSRVRDILALQGYDPARIRVVQQGHASADRVWDLIGKGRRHQLKPPHEPIQLVYIGAVLPQKGVHTLVQAMQALPPEVVRCDVWGMAPPDYFNLLRNIDKAGSVRFRGRYDLDDLPTILAGADAVVVPSVWEDCAPLVLNEAKAARVPIVGSRIGGVTEAVREGIDGLLFRPGDSVDLARKLAALVQDHGLLLRLQNSVGPPRSFSSYVDEIQAIYNEYVLSKRCNQARYAQISKELSVRWEGAQLRHHSLALVNRELCLRLVDTAVELSLTPSEPNEFGIEVDPRFEKLLQRFDAPLVRPADIYVRHQWPPNLIPPPEGHWVIIQPWEYGTIPRRWVEVMATQVDEVWVPSHYVRNCYVLSGVPADRVQVVPNGVDPERFHPQAPPLDLSAFGVSDKGFRFLFVGGTIIRKGIDVLLQAYGKAFTRADDVCLVIKDMGNRTFYRGQTWEQTIRELQSTPDAPRIVYIDQDLSPTQLPGLYTACDCLVHPYRGEGFGLPIAEAMACGLPVIVTGYGAAMDFCDPETAYLIPAVVRKRTDPGLMALEPAGSLWLAEPDIEALARLMRHVYEHRDEARAKGRKASERIRSRFTWERAAETALARMRALRGQPIRRYEPAAPVPVWSEVGQGPLILAERRSVHLLMVPDWNDPEDCWADALRAFASEFGPEDDVALIVRVDPLEAPDPEGVLRRIERWAEREGINLDGDPLVLFLNNLLDPTRRDLIYGTAQILVDLSDSARGRTLRSEAIAHGLVVCRPNRSAMREAYGAVRAAQASQSFPAAPLKR